jgi:hypothetical protein
MAKEGMVTVEEMLKRTMESGEVSDSRLERKLRDRLRSQKGQTLERDKKLKKEKK